MKNGNSWDKTWALSIINGITSAETNNDDDLTGIEKAKCKIEDFHRLLTCMGQSLLTKGFDHLNEDNFKIRSSKEAVMLMRMGLNIVESQNKIVQGETVNIINNVDMNIHDRIQEYEKRFKSAAESHNSRNNLR
jgi:hypothetical protein